MGYLGGTEYLTSSRNELGILEIVELSLTSVDLKLFLEQYEVTDLEYIDGWKFRSRNGMFDEYIDKWMEVKKQATIEKNAGKRTMAKLMLNALYRKTCNIINSKIKNTVFTEMMKLFIIK